MLLLALAQIASAQDVEAPALNAQLYRPPVDSQATLWTDDSYTSEDLRLIGRTFLQYVNDPFVYEDADGNEMDLVGSLIQMDLIGGISIKNVRFALDAPIYLNSTSDFGEGGAGLGDLALDVKGTLLDRESAPIGLALGGRLALPTASVDIPLGHDGAAWALQAIADKELGPVLLAANVGTRGVPNVEMDNVEWGDQFFYRLGGGYSLSDEAGVSLDIAGNAFYSAPLSNPAGSPVEGMVGGWYRLSEDWALRGGLGTGLTGGIGAPKLRAVFSLSYEPPAAKDTDLDGLVDRSDECPTDPEDKDGYMDSDGCPDPSTAVRVRVVDPNGDAIEGASVSLEGASGEGEVSLELHPGSYPISASAEGFQPTEASLSVPGDASYDYDLTLEWIPGTLTLTVVDGEGNPVVANWGIDRENMATLDESGTVSASLPPGQHTLRVRAADYKAENQAIEIASEQTTALTVTLESTKIKVTAERIELQEKVYFDTGKATIKAESHSMLDEVANVMQDHPEITKLRIEGHTDSRGNNNSNQTLSEERAAAVADYLAAAGVSEDRLHSVGYGEDKPIASNNTSSGREQNRRVEIHIESRSDGAEKSAERQSAPEAGSEPEAEKSAERQSAPEAEEATPEEAAPEEAAPEEAAPEEAEKDAERQ